MTALVLDLDDPGAQDPDVAGAKAARLAVARAAGLPVLPGVVVVADCGRPSLDAGADALASGGSGRARLATMNVAPDPALWTELVDGLRWPYESLIVRSSSRLEAGGAWSGAFSTFAAVTVDELSTAVRGVWTSVFTVDAVDRLAAADVDAADVDMAVLVQPYVTPSVGGTAAVASDGSVDLAVTADPLQQLTAGWARATRVVVAPDGGITIRSGAAVDPDAVRSAAALARDVRRKLGDDHVEWGLVGGTAVVLQTSRSTQQVAPAAEPLGTVHPVALRLALAAMRYRGRLGLELVLPWALGSPRVDVRRGTVSSQPVTDLVRACALARRLTQHAWGVDWITAPDVLRAAAGGSAEAFDRLGRLRPVRGEDARCLLDLLDGAVGAMVRTGQVRQPHDAWQQDAAQLVECLETGRPIRAVTRAAPDRFEPLVFAALTAVGPTITGEAAAPGFGAGPVIVVDDAQAPVRTGARDVIVAERPVPALASLLWGAAGLVTVGGSSGAHLVEVARSLGVPAVVAVDLPASGWPLHRLGMLAGTLAAVDGDSGSVTLHAAPDVGGR